jgi:hypothetical protein
MWAMITGSQEDFMKALSACFAIGVVFLGCSSGSSSDAAAGTCGKVAACGGNLVGTWKFVAGCANAASSGGSTSACPNETQVVSVSVSGSVTFNSDLTFSVDVTESVSDHVVVPTSCLTVAGMSVSCDALATALSAAQGVDAGGGSTSTCSMSGTACDCDVSLSGLTTQQMGTYTVSNNSFVTSSGGMGGGDYCVQGNTLHLISSSMMTGGVATDLVATKQ